VTPRFRLIARMASRRKESGDSVVLPSGSSSQFPSQCLIDSSTSLASLYESPARRLSQWLHSRASIFGVNFLLLVFFGEHILKGFLDGGGGGGGFLVIENLLYMELQVGASTKNVLVALSSASWSLKPIFGLLSDTVVINGYRRTPWIILTAGLSSVAYVCIYAFGARISPDLLCLCFFFVRMQTAWTDLAVQATAAEMMAAQPEHSTDIVTWVWGGNGLATLLAVFIAGPAIAYLGPFNVAGLAIPLALAIVIPACFGLLEEKTADGINFGVQWDIIDRQRPLVVCSAVLSLAIITTSACALIGVPYATQACVACSSAVVVALTAVWLTPPGFWKPMLFMFLCSAVSVNTYGFADNFYLDAPDAATSALTGYPVCVDCPHFSYTYYITGLGICDAVFVSLGSWMFNDWMPNWTYRRCICITMVLWVAAGLLDVVQFHRLNVRYGIPDEHFMVFKRAVQGTAGMLNFLPTTILVSKLCPEGIESTVFALLTGFSNFGLTVGSFVGAFALQGIGMANIGAGDVDDFSNAWQASMINALSPVVALVFVPFLIPDACMHDVLALRTFGVYETAVTDEVAAGMSMASTQRPSERDLTSPMVGDTFPYRTFWLGRDTSCRDLFPP